ncbi:endolytic transglycosylase MltG [Euzebya tangerina]|uniref:endolytic transglycosylase MltG n=1 Tax=Euzebya tangerina TaxID=591198 RepID=UPI000E31D75C|nr:endolytic transglycosylase MltG [Euzebya tangerina]
MSNSSKVFLIVLIAMVGGGFYAFNQWNAGASSGNELAAGPVDLTIPEGTGARAVSQLLEDNGVITSAGAFTAFAAADGRANQIQAGFYTLQPGTSNEELLDILVTGPAGAETFTVTIPEGLSVSETLARIAEAEGSQLTVEELRAGLALVALPEWVPADRELPEGGEAFEGLLFPETYEFTVEQPAEEVLTRLVQQTDTVLNRVGAASRNELTLYETLVLASLVEDEARVAEERPVISSVIHNRLEIGQALQIDATVVYGIVAAGLERPERLVNEDYEFQSPWSTYVNAGLPPTPLSGAGEASIQAAAQPADTPFFYYVVENPETGEHRFSETLEQHQAAIAEIRGS